MNTNKHRNGIGFDRKVLVLALLAAFGPVHAEDDEVAALISPDTTTVSVGVGAVSGDSKDRSIFGQYNGWRNDDANLPLDFDHVRRSEDGLWTKVQGRNLGQEDREFGFSSEKQGDWKVSLDYSELVHRDPRTINTGVEGVRTTTPLIGNSLATPGAGSETDLALKRKGLTLEASRRISPNLSFDVSFKNEDKNGARLTGIGGYCSDVIGTLVSLCPGAVGTVAALYLTPEPVNSTAQQFEAKLNYAGEKFALTGGYYGSFYSNSNGAMTPGFANGAATTTSTGDALGPLAANLWRSVALPPDNQAHQIYLSGYYALQPTTRVTFKTSYTRATQDQSFAGQGLMGAPAGVSGLNGSVDTALAQVGFTARPLPKLSLNASVRYEDRQNNTDLANYVVDTHGVPYTNALNSSTRINSKAEASYQFSSLYRGTLGVDYAYINRDRPVGTALIADPYNPSISPMAALRERTNEFGVRAELRRSMTETLNATVSVGHSERDGYHWYGLDQASGYAFLRYDALPGLNGTFPMTLVDRKRDKVKLMADWTPAEALSLQFSVEHGKDRYEGPTQAGLHDTGFYGANVDAALTLSDNWKMTGYASYGRQTLHMQQGIGYIADLPNVTTTLGLGVVGTPTAKVEVGGDLSYLQDKSHYDLSMTTGAAVSDLPDVSYRSTLLKLYGKYALDKQSDVRLDLIQQWARFNDWAWGSSGVPFAYSDNTTVTLQPSQDVTFLGVRYIYKFK